MSRNMLRPVTDRDHVLPVLVECQAGKRGDGYALDARCGRTAPVRVLPQRAWNSFRSDGRWQQFCLEYGVLDERQAKLLQSDLLMLARLSQAIQTRSVRIYQEQGEIKAKVSGELLKYVEMQAARQVHRMSQLPLPKMDEESREKLQEDIQRDLAELQKKFAQKSPEDLRHELAKEMQADEVLNRLLPPHGNPFVELSEQLNRHSKSGRLVLWWSEREKMLRAGLYFERVEDAIFALFTLQVALPRGVGICERCGKVFQRFQVTQKYCSVRCGNYIRKNRERQKSRTDFSVNGARSARRP